MMKVEWKDEYNIGIASIDRQHQKLFVYLSDIRLALINDDQEEAIQKAIQNLIDYGIEHFSFEEALLKEGNYDLLDEHHELHNSYNEKLIRFKNKLVHNDDPMGTELIIFIKKWLLEHILVEDMKYINSFKLSGFRSSNMD